MPPASPKPEPYEFDALPEDLQEVIKAYAKAISKLNNVFSEDDWNGVRDSFSQNKNYHETDEGKKICQHILETYKPYLLSNRPVTLGDQVCNLLELRWKKLIKDYNENREDDASLSEIPNLSEGLSSANFLTIITENPTEAEAVLCERFVTVDINDFAPFDFNFREYANTHRHFKDSLRNTSTHKKEAPVLIRRFFCDPAYGRMSRDDLDPEIKKIIRLFDTAKSRFLSAYFFTALSEDRKYAYDRDNIRRMLDLLTWKEYIEPNPSESNMDRLCTLIAQNKGVEIFGRGGLGKTALAYQFIRRNLDDNTHYMNPITGRVTIDQFKKFVIITSKSREQGEGEYWNYKVRKIGDPRSPDHSIAEYNPNGAYDTFIHRLASLDEENETDNLERKALSVIENQRVLVVIDNYEDISKDDKNHKKYVEFLKTINPSSKGRVIVTSRPPSMGDTNFPVIQLKPFPTKQIYDLLRTRIQWLNENYPEQYTWSRKALDLILDSQFEIILKKVIDKLGDGFKTNMGSPPILFVFTTILAGREEVGQSSSDDASEDKEKLIERIANDSKLIELIKEQDIYSVNHAYGLLENKPVERRILQELYSSFSMLSSDDLLERMKVEKEFVRNTVDKALDGLESHQLFLEVHFDEDTRTGKTYLMSDIARRVLGKSEDFEDLDVDRTQIELEGRLSNERDKLEELKDLITNPQDFSSIQNALDDLVGDGMTKAREKSRDTSMDRRIRINPQSLMLANACRVVLLESKNKYRDYPRIVELIEEFNLVILNAASVSLANPKKLQPRLQTWELARLFTEISNDHVSDEWIRGNLEHASKALTSVANSNSSETAGFSSDLLRLLSRGALMPQDMEVKD